MPKPKVTMQQNYFYVIPKTGCATLMVDYDWTAMISLKQSKSKIGCPSAPLTMLYIYTQSFNFRSTVLPETSFDEKSATCMADRSNCSALSQQYQRIEPSKVAIICCFLTCDFPSSENLCRRVSVRVIYSGFLF